MNEAREGVEQLAWARFSRLSSRLETSSVTVIEMERALIAFRRVVSEMVSTISSSLATWNVETGSKVNAPGPVVEKS
jgi:hypothetical protein